MLNKELLLATESQIAGHIKLTVGEISGTFGYFEDRAGSINRIPTWNKGENPIKMFSILTDPEIHNTVMDFYQQVRVNADSITMTVVEKKVDSGIKLALPLRLLHNDRSLRSLRSREDIYYCF